MGLPFKGKSGQLLDSFIELIESEGIKFTYGITNVVCCIPLEDKVVSTPHGEITKKSIRIPTQTEANACRFRLLETIRIANPSLIVVLGKTAKKYVKIPARHECYGTPILELQHPAYIIRNGGKNSLHYKRNYLYLKEEVEKYGTKETISGLQGKRKWQKVVKRQTK